MMLLFFSWSEYEDDGFGNDRMSSCVHVDDEDDEDDDHDADPGDSDCGGYGEEDDEEWSQ